MMKKVNYELSDTEIREALMRYVQTKTGADWETFAGAEIHASNTNGKHLASVYMRYEDVE